MDKLDRAKEIALASLRQCYSPLGILAGRHHFTDNWVRDSSQACLGAVRAEKPDKAQARKNLEIIASYQRKDGMIPLRIGAGTLAFKQLMIKGILPDGFNLKLDWLWGKITGRHVQAVYTTSKNVPFTATKCIDSGSWFVIAVADYVKQAHDLAFARANFETLKKAIRWTESQDKDHDGLVEEGVYAGWADAIRKRGKVLYSNVLYAKALRCMSELSGIIGRGKDKKLFFEKSIKTKRKINEVFWNGKYYIDWIDKGKKFSHLSTYDNALAVVFDIADFSQANSIENENNLAFGKRMMFNPHSGLAAKKNVPILLRMAGLSDYQNLSWLHVGCMDAIAKIKIGRYAEAGKLMKAIAGRIVAYKHVYEIYEKEGTPVNRWLYKSEGPFAWASGLYLFAYGKLKRRKA